MRLVVAAAVAAATGCGADDPAPPVQPSPTPPAIVGMQIEGPPVRDIGAVGDTLQLRAIATLADGTRPDVTAESIWAVTNSNVLSVSPRGLVTAVGNGGAFVSATYRERAGTTNLTVRPEAGPRYPLTGVVVDAETRLPVSGAFVSAASTSADRLAFTDGNGFFDLGTAIRPVTLTVTLFGYGDAVQVVSEPRGPAHAAIGLTPNGPYVERTVEVDGLYMDGVAVASHRIVTRPSGVFDAVATTTGCDYGADVAVTADSGGRTFTSRAIGCAARVRFVVPAPEILLTFRSYRSTRVHLTYREPR